MPDQLLDKLQLHAFEAFYEEAVTEKGDGIDARMQAFAEAIFLSSDERFAEAIKRHGPLIAKWKQLITREKDRYVTKRQNRSDGRSGLL